MDKQLKLRISLELLWWVFTALVCCAVVYYPMKELYSWPFLWWNVAFIVVLITLTRYMFLLKHSLIAKQQEVKIVLLLLMFPLLFVMIDGLNGFMSFIEEKTWDPITGYLYEDDRKAMEQYLWGEMLFFGTGSIIAAPVFIVRMLISIWRTRNKGTS